MFKVLKLMILIFCTTTLLAQNDYNIELPSSSNFSSKRINSITGSIEIHINGENEIYLRGEKINYPNNLYQEIANTSFRDSLPSRDYNFVLVADKSTKLSVVYDILEQLGKFSKPYIYLKVDNIDSHLYEICILHGFTPNGVLENKTGLSNSKYEELSISDLGFYENEEVPDARTNYEILNRFKDNLYKLKLDDTQKIL